MTPAPSNCDAFVAMLPELLEGSADVVSRDAAESHRAECARCRALHDDLVALRHEAGALPVLKPSHDLWDGIATRLPATPATVLHPVAPRWWHAPQRLAAAAVVMMAVTAGITWTLARTAPSASPSEAPTFADATNTVPLTPVARVAAAYDGDIAQIREILATRPPSLDAATARVLEENLRVIDDAIARARTALTATPANPILTQQLAYAYDRKLRFLRRVAELPTTTE